MKVLAVHPSGLMYTEVFLRLEPLGLELAAQALRRTVAYQIRTPPAAGPEINANELYVYPPQGRRARAIDDSTEHFVDTTRMRVDGQ